MAYTSTSFMFRSLDDTEEEKFREYAKNNNPENLESWEGYHPVCRDEWKKRGIHKPGCSCGSPNCSEWIACQ